jgi:hypothetical protein
MSADPNNEAAPNGAPDPVSATIAFWSQWMEQTTRGTQAILEALGTAGDPNELQKRWSEATAEAAENFMRTPAFMEAMRRNLKAVTDMKRMQDNIVQDTARHLGLPLADDITGLFERLNGTERKILARLKAIEDRLEAVESALAAAPKKRPAQGPQGESR